MANFEIHEIKEEIENPKLDQTVKNLENWIITGNTNGDWFYKNDLETNKK